MTSEMAAPDEPIKNRDMLALKRYLQAKDSTRYDSLEHTNLVLVDLTHSNLQQKHIEIRFSRHDTVSHLKSRIHLNTGTSPHHQHLVLYDGTTELAQIPDSSDDKTESLPLGYFGLEHGMRVHCIDTNPHSDSANGAYEDTSLVEKYRMTEAEYNARKGTLRDWARKQKQEDPNFSLRRHAERQRAKVEAVKLNKQGLPLPPGFYVDNLGQVEYDSDCEKQEQEEGQETTTASQPQASEFGPESVEGISLEMRCQVEPGCRRGKIGFVGEIPELPDNGNWVGVILDEPGGQNDGSVKGVMYMPATPGPRYGVFCRPNKVQVGDFPELDDLLDDSSEDEL
jgi:tubulin-folding cofactor B